VTLPNGSVQTFTQNSDGTFTAYDSRNTLTRQEDGAYILTSKDQTSYGFNSDGFLVWMKDRYGNTVNITVDGTGKVQKIIDTVGREYNISYENGYIKAISDPIGRTVTYEYANGNLVRVKEPEGKYTRYSYDSEGYLSEIRDHSNNLLESITYLHASDENQHKVDYTIDAYGNRFTYSYDNVRGKTTITDSNGRQSVKWYDSSYSITNSVDAEGLSTSIEYYKDANNINRYWEEKSITDRNGNITRYERDSSGNITKITNPDNSIKEMAYDSKNNMIWEKDETGRYTFYIYDTEGTYLLKKVQPLNGTDRYVEGESNEENFAITHYAYYNQEECLQLGYRVKGLLKTVTDSENNTTTYTYDAYGNVVTVEDPETHKLTRYEYNPIGWKEAEVSPKSYRTEYDYDNNGRVIRTILADGETTRIVYNALGQVKQEVSPNLYSSELDDRTNNTYSGDHGTRYTYYPTGKLHTITDAEGNTTTYTYDIYGNIKTEAKPNDAVYSYDYDILNRVTKKWFRENQNADTVLLEEFRYEIMSDKKTRTTHSVYVNSTEKLTTVYTYDYAGRPVTQQNPDNTILTTKYYPNGTVEYTTDAKQYKTYYKYDGQNRPNEQWSPAEDNNGTVRYAYQKITYDKAGRQKQIFIGKEMVSLYAVPSTFAVTTMTYYRNGNLKSKSDSEGRRTEYRYDDDGNLAAQDVFIDEEIFETVEYGNNHMGKPVEERRTVRNGDLFGNDFDDNGTTTLRTLYTYDDNGNLKTVTTPNGVTIIYRYDNLNRQVLVSMPGEDEYGNATTITNVTRYNWEGKVRYTEDARGNRTSYEYDPRGFLTKTVNAEDGVTAFWYDLAGRVTAEVSPNHYDSSKTLEQMNRKEYAYDNMGRVIAETETFFDGDQWTSFVSKAYQYDANGNVTKELDALGYEYGTGTTHQQKISTGYGTEYTHDLRNNVLTVLDPVSKQKGLQYTVKYTYDALGRRATETNAKGSIFTYAYDDAGNLLTTEVQTNSSSPKQLLQQNRYDYLGRLLSQTDGNGNTVTYEYNGFGRLRKTTYPGDESIPENTIRYQYDVMSNLKLQENSMGVQDLFTYDNQNRQLGHIHQRNDGTDRITTSVRYDVNGNVRFETDGNNVTAEKTYDEMNRPKTVTLTVSGVEKTTTYRYDKNGNLTHETDWRQNTWTNVYDPLNRLIEKWDPYNNCIQKLEYNHNHAQTKSYDALNNLTQYEYDRNNRLVKTIDPELHETTQSYDAVGNIEVKRDGRNNTTTFQYDEMNRLIKVINAKNEETGYTYDLNGNMLTQTDGKGNITTYEFNCANLVVRRIDHGGRTGTPGEYVYDPIKTESYTYYADGTLKTRIDRNGETTTYTYDCHGRLKSETVGGSTISYTYDGNGNQLTITDDTGATIRTYDELNRVTSKTVPNVGTVEYGYDILEGVETGETSEKTTDPAGNVTTRIYDRTGRLKVAIEGDITSTARTTYEYYANGSRKSVIYPTGVREEYTYYPDNTLWTLTNQYADGTIMDVYTYTYDEANNQTSKHEIINGVEKGTTLYTYDSLNRLETVTEPGGRTTTYTYDRAGNRETETITENGQTVVNTYYYNAQNRLMNFVTKTDGTVAKHTVFIYDNNGNQLKTEETKYIDGIAQTPVITAKHTYDKRNQIIETVTADGSTLINAYNGEGLRVSKTVNGETTYFLYEYDKIVLEVNGDGTQKARNLYGTNLLMRTVDNEAYYYLYNGHADVTALLSTDGTIAATYYYDAFGNILEQTGDVDNNITYAGYQYDDETGLYYLNARMYDPKIARFLQEDTYRGDPNDPLSLNLYTYCTNNPLAYYDPTGHKGELLSWFSEGWKVLISGSQEEREEAFSLIDEYGILDANEKRWLGLGIIAVDTIKGTVDLGLTIGDAIGNLALANTYDDVDYRIELNKNVETLKSIPQNMLKGTINNVLTLLKREKVDNFFFNPEASLASIVEYESAGISTGMTAYGGAKFLQSGHQLINGIHFSSTGGMTANITGTGGLGGISLGTGIGISISVDSGLVGSAAVAAAGAAANGAVANIAFASGGGDGSSGRNSIDGGTSKTNERGVGGKGWRGDKAWRESVTRVGEGGTIEDLNGQVPTLDEAMTLIKESGGKVLRVEGAHDFPNPHNYVHINYTTPSGGKGTIKIK
jgi:RHS repeat-associated protein